MYDREIKSGIEANTYLHSNSSHKGVVCVKVCIGFNARLFVLPFCILIPIKTKEGGLIALTEIISHYQIKYLKKDSRLMNL